MPSTQPGPEPRTAPPADILIENAYILTMDPAAGDIPRGRIAVENGLITEIGPMPPEAPRAGTPAKKTIDASGSVVMPGLINTHTHLTMTLFRGFADDLPLKTWLEDHIWPAEARLTEPEFRLGSRLGCLEMIKSGTTAFADMYFNMDRTAEAVEESGLRAALCHGMIELDSPRKADAELEEAARFARRWNRAADGRITAMYGPHAPNTCSGDFLRRVSEHARKENARIHIHILETETERSQLEAEYGPEPLIHLDSLGILGPDVLAAHCIWLSDEEIELMAERGTHVAHNPVCNMKIASGIAPVTKMLNAGVSVSIGTDGCASNNNLDMFEEMKTAALLQKVAVRDAAALPARQVLEMAAVNAAAALNINSGMLKTGMNADLIIIDMARPHFTPVYDVPSHLVYTTSGRDVSTTIVAGRILMENRRVLTLSEDEILGEVAALERGLAFNRVSLLSL